MKAREFLIQKGQRPGLRGKLSEESLDLLDKAITEDGIELSDYSLADVNARRRKLARKEQKPGNGSSTIKTEIATRPSPVREEDQQYTIDENGVKIAVDECYRCHKAIRFCPCSPGPILPKYLGGGVGLLRVGD